MVTMVTMIMIDDDNDDGDYDDDGDFGDDGGNNDW